MSSLNACIDDYIGRIIRNYVEPERRGRTKGDVIGMSATKFKVALLIGLGRYKTHKELAVNVGVSYGVVRKWNGSGDKDFEFARNHAPAAFIDDTWKGLKQKYRLWPRKRF